MAINSNMDFMVRLLKQYEPQLPVSELVAEVNKLYHSFEAQDYNVHHAEIYNQLPLVWQEMIRSTAQKCGPTGWRILDFGCGTGFEAEQLIRGLPKGTINQLTCYDPSPEMLERCHARISSLFPDALFTTDRDRLRVSDEPYNLLATNSLIHHLFDPVMTINGLLPLLALDAVWLAGHEPSNRFYRNSECVDTYERFLRERNWRKYICIDNYLRRIKKISGLSSDPARRTAKEAFQKGLFKRAPSPFVIGRLVDFHVAHSFEEAGSGRGFDFEVMQQDLAGYWDLIWIKTYSFMGPMYEGSLPKKWALLCRNLATKFPEDGANFCAVWRRRSLCR